MQICRLIIVGLLASVVSLASVGGLLSKVCFTSYFTSLKKLQPIVYGLYLTMPATATNAIVTAASAVAGADGSSAAYLRSCRHQYCGAGVLLLSRGR